MPVTIKPSEKVGRNSDPIAASSKGLIDRAAFSFERKPVLHYSFQDLDNKDDPNRAKVISYENGFVRGVIRAYQQDLHLVLRPDDIWLAIITQFSFYVTSHAEELRSKFVAHEGQKELVLEIKEGFVSLNVPAMARKFTCLIEEHLVDKEVRNWIIPDFSTTTDNDMAVASLAMMATMKKFFSYTAISMCGFPSVTLLGEKQDWEEIRRRVDRLAMYGDEPEEWSQLLIPVLDRFVKTFEEPESPELKRFWDEVCYAEGARGSGGVPTYSGWITAFAYWTTDGKRNRGRGLWDKKEYQLDDQTYPIIGQRDVPSGVMEIPLKFLAYELGTEFDTTLVAGSVGVSVNEDGDAGTVVQPRSGWWMFENSRKAL